MKTTTLIVGIVLGVCAPTMSFAEQCVPYARNVSGIELRGNAWRWWSEAEGRYQRGTSPRVGAVMVFKPVGRMRNGHLAVVRHVINSREIRIDHANWPRNSGVSLNQVAVDVSPRNDWSQVRVASGARTNPLHGFIYSDPRHNDEPRIMEASAQPQPAVTMISSAKVRHVTVEREPLPAAIATPVLDTVPAATPAAAPVMLVAAAAPVMMAAATPPAPVATDSPAPVAAKPALNTSTVTNAVALPASSAAARLNAAVLARLRGVSPDQVLQPSSAKHPT